MLTNASLIKTGSGWEFVSEEILEDFLYENLEKLLDLNVLDRQYIVNNQRCDILAVDSNKKLVILELKNVEDRGIVQQLTRYYDALLDEQPFSDKVDYQQPVRLIAITPNFHRDNFTDRKYHTLDFQFLEFSVIENEDKFYISLKDVDNGKISKTIIPYKELENDLDLPDPPEEFLRLLSNFELSQQQHILEVRRKILKFDTRIQEFPSTSSIKYGNGSGKTNKLCAEILLDKRELILFLWIPYKSGESSRIGRARIWTDWQDKALIEGYVSSGVGTEINKHKRSMQKLLEAIQGRNQGKRRGSSYIRYYNDKGQMYHYTLPVVQNTARKYLTAIRRIQSAGIEKKPITYEDAEFINVQREIFKKKTGIEYKSQLIPNKSLESLQVDFNPYKSLDSLIDMALEKWLERL